MEILQLTTTPFYYYDLDVLRTTLAEIRRLTADGPYSVHYAVKANGNPRIISEIAQVGLGADLVSGHEIEAALAAGIPASEMSYSGVGKTDWEIRTGISHDIGCFNVESVPELEVINAIAGEMDATARVAIRVNPDIDAHTHKYITTGTADNKFGIPLESLQQVIGMAMSMPNIHLSGLHFHIGSQITQMQPYEMLCDTINSILDQYEGQGIQFEIINVGGGLGIDYDNPDTHPLPDLERYFSTFKQRLHLREGQRLHFELGRAIVGGCGSLICRTSPRQAATSRPMTWWGPCANRATCSPTTASCRSPGAATSSPSARQGPTANRWLRPTICVRCPPASFTRQSTNSRLSVI